MKEASKQRNRNNSRLAKKRRSDPVQARQRKRRMRRTRIRKG
jgi:hypothetical protein